jgi:hypothetical protein
VNITSPANGANVILPAVIVAANASDNVGVTRVELSAQPGTGLIATLSTQPYRALWAPLCNGNIQLKAKAFDACDNVGQSTITVQVNILLLPSCGGGATSTSSSTRALRTVLAVPGGRGLGMVNEREAFVAATGESLVSFQSRGGANRVEARLAAGLEKPGTWSFELTGLTPGSLRVVAGQVAQVAAGRIVFRMSGRPGELIVFSFQTEP